MKDFAERSVVSNDFLLLNSFIYVPLAFVVICDSFNVVCLNYVVCVPVMYIMYVNGV